MAKRNKIKNENQRHRGRRGSDQSKQFDHENGAKIKEEENGRSSSPRINDASSYTPSPQLVKDVANISMYTRTGVPMDMGIPWVSDVTNPQAKVMPGIMSFYFVPTFGIAQQYEDPLNINAQAIFAFVRKANSGRVNYDASDLFCYIGAVSSIILYHSMLMGIVGRIGNYNQENAYQPEGLVDAFGIDYYDAVENLPQLRSYCNQLALQINNYFLPDVLPFLKEQIKMVGNYYKDADSGKAQLYQFVPIGYYYYDEISNEEGSQLVFEKFVSDTDVRNTLKRKKVSDLISFGRFLMGKLTQSYDSGVYDGDLRKAYGDKRYIASEVDEQYTIMPTQSDEILSKVNNMTIWPSFEAFDLQNLTIRPIINTQTLVQSLLIGSFHFGEDAAASEVLKALNSNKLLNFYWSNISNDDVLVATRWMTFGATDTGTPTSNQGETYLRLDNYGFEVFMGGLISYRQSPTVANTNGFQYRRVSTSMWIEDPADDYPGLFEVAATEKFDWHPYKYLYVYETSEYINPQLLDIIGDVDNFAIVNKSTIQNIHMVATEGGLGLPQSV